MTADTATQAAARHAVRRALLHGDIERGPCAHRFDVELRGACSGRIEAHHEDHTRQLDVVWLCLMHHRRLHGARTWGNYTSPQEAVA